MATAEDYAAWIIRNQGKKGTPEFEKVVAAYQAKIAGEDQARKPKQPKAGRSIGEAVLGAAETGLAMATGATTGMALRAAGTVSGVIDEVKAGTYGTPEAANRVEQAAMAGMQAGTYTPRSEAGRSYTEAVGEAADVLAPLGVVAPVTMPLQGAMAGAAPAARAIAAQQLPKAVQAVKGAGAKAGQMVESVKGKIGIEPSPFGKGTVGAAETPAAIQRRTVAESMPVPFTGESSLTRGQASREGPQLQFEKEAMKTPEGEALARRVENQTATTLKNFDYLIEQANPRDVMDIDIGKGVDRAIVNKAELAKKQINAAYKKADEAGQMADPVDTAQLATLLNNSIPDVATAPVIDTAVKRAIRLGIVAQDADGNLVPAPTSVRNVEAFRQSMNQLYDPTHKPNARAIGIMRDTVDAMTEAAGGDLYKQARKLRKDYAREFENVGIVADLLGQKRGTDARKIAYEDVFKKIILDSPLPELNKARRTLITAGPEGKQAWQDLKARGLQELVNKGFSQNQTDSAGNPIVLPSQLNNIIRSMDREGKLEGLYGKKQAQLIRDLGELSRDMMTAPPGLVNHSNTASAVRNMLIESGGMAFATGVPLPAIAATKQALKFVKNRQTAKRIQDALEPKAKK